jgi:hypothetical protein
VTIAALPPSPSSIVDNLYKILPIKFASHCRERQPALTSRRLSDTIAITQRGFIN